MIRNIQNVDDYIITAKRLIKTKLYSDPDIIEVLDNPELNHDEPDSYIGVNIFPHIMLPGTLPSKNNYICFDIKRKEIPKANDYMSEVHYIFNVYSHQDLLKTPYGIERHDLLAYLVRDIFNYSNFMGCQLCLDSDTPGIMDAYYASRSLVFKVITPNEPNRAVKTNKYEFSK